MALHFWLWVICFVAVVELQNDFYVNFFEKLKLIIPGDVMIGALFPIHEQPKVQTAYSRECGNIREKYGIHRIELLLLVLREINNDPNILPGVTLGVDARDSCWYPPIALEQCMDFVRTALIYKEFRACMRVTNESKESCLPTGVLRLARPIVALVGPGSSEMTKQVHQTMQLLSIPQIGYSATAADLSNIADYQYFLRVVPSDVLQVEAIISILRQFKWNYVALVNSKGFYGDKGISKLKKSMLENSICSEAEFRVDNRQTDEHFLQFTKTMLTSLHKAKVIVCFCQGETVMGIFRAMTRLGLANQGYVFIGSDGWADRTDVLGAVINESTRQHEFSDVAVGSMSIRLRSPSIPKFDDYFMSLTPTNNLQNPWFREFWEDKFHCQINHHTNLEQHLCSGKETLKSSLFKQDNNLWLLNISIYAVALALDKVHDIKCGPDYVGICDDFLPVDGVELRRQILQIKFKDNNGELVYFDENGDPPGSYEIMNYQQFIDMEGKMRYDYQYIGSWKDGNLSLSNGHIQWPLSYSVSENDLKADCPVKSFCSAPCTYFESKVVHEKSKSCCWICQACLPNEMKNQNGSCEACVLGFKPIENRTECETIIPKYRHWSSALSLFSSISASFGVILTLIVFIRFALYRNTAIMKASTREFMYVILVGSLIAHASAYVASFPPTRLSCALNNALPGQAFAMIYGALITKIICIFRIHESSKRFNMKKLRFLSAKAQLVITFGIILLELVIIGFTIWFHPPDTILIYNNHSTESRICCKTSLWGNLLPLVVGIILIGLCTIYSIKTRNLSNNLNEAKFIGLTMYATCVIWLTIIPVYMSGYKTEFTLTLACSLSATIALLILFIPKTCIILFHPEKNSINAFITLKDIRCHIDVLQINVDSYKESNRPNLSHLANTKVINELFSIEDGSSVTVKSGRQRLESGFCQPKNNTQDSKKWSKNNQNLELINHRDASDIGPLKEDPSSDEFMNKNMFKTKNKSLILRRRHLDVSKRPKNIVSIENAKFKQDKIVQTDWSFMPQNCACEACIAVPEEVDEDDFSLDFRINSCSSPENTPSSP